MRLVGLDPTKDNETTSEQNGLQALVEMRQREARSILPEGWADHSDTPEYQLSRCFISQPEWQSYSAS